MNDVFRRATDAVWRGGPLPPDKAYPFHLILKLQRTVGNREVQRFLAPKPVIAEPPPVPVLPAAPLPVPPPAPVAPSQREVWMGVAAAAGAGVLAGAGLGAALRLPIEIIGAMALVGSGVGMLAVRLIHGRK